MMARTKPKLWHCENARSLRPLWALEEMGIKVDYIEISDSINADASLGTPVFTGYVSANPDVKLIITDHGALTATAETYMRASRKKPGDIYIAGFDLSAATVRFGRKEIELAEHEMPGLMSIRKKYAQEKPLRGARIMGSLHMTIRKIH